MTPPFEWSGFFRLAQELVRPAANEAELRTAISRAYYCAYNLARQQAEREGPISARVDSHEAVWRSLERRGGLRGTIALDGKRLEHRRVDADYRDVVPNVRANAESALLLSERTIQRLQRLGP